MAETMTKEVVATPVAPELPGLAECWRGMPNKEALGFLLAGWVALFHWLGNATLGYVDTQSLFGWLYSVC
jgi:hypothetical protein